MSQSDNSPDAVAQEAESQTTEARSPKPVSGRILGLDVGARRIGMAVSDLLGITAQGIETMQRKNKRTDFAELLRVIREYGVKEIVVGLPLRMSGAEGIQSEKMQEFAQDLRKRSGCPCTSGMSASPPPKPTACCARLISPLKRAAKPWTGWQQC